MRKSILLLLFGTFLFAQHTSQAQQRPSWEEEGEIEEAEVIIEKEREIKLPKANRNFERVPPLPVQKPDLDISYQYREIVPQLQQLNPPIRVLKVKEPPLPKLYSNYVRAGFGNYITPYLEVFTNSNRNEDYNYGLHLRHLSSRNGPVDGANSGNSDTRIGLNGKYFAAGHTLFGDVSYQRERYHFYGYAPETEPVPERADIRQIFNTFSANGGVERNDADASLDYRLQLGFHAIGDAYQASENEFAVNFSTAVDISELLELRLESDFYLINRTDAPFDQPEEESSIQRTLFRIRPYFAYRSSEEPQQGIEVRVGANLAYENDTLSNADRLHFYPYLSATYHLNENLNVYGRLDGDIEKNTYREFTNENPWLAANAPVFHTNRTLALSGGISGRASSFLGFNAGLSAGNYKNLYFFVNSALDSTRFDVLYDQENVFVFNLFGEVNLNSRDRFRTTLRADYFAYSTEQVAEAWHRPELKLSVLSSYNVYDKLLLNAEFMLMSGLQGLNLESGTVTELEPLADLSLKGDYIFSPRFSTFLQFKNIFAQNYERYLNYPTRGFMIMAGVTYSF
ncbi:MAG: hypothetical protein ACLFUB_11925 [Cyclobacteriaceae bacterium]